MLVFCCCLFACLFALGVRFKLVMYHASSGETFIRHLTTCHIWFCITLHEGGLGTRLQCRVHDEMSFKQEFYVWCHAIVPDCKVCPSCSTSTVLASVITAIVAALLATVISVLVTIAVCKCHSKFTPGGAKTATSAGGEGQEYEGVGGNIYTKVGEGRGGNTFELQENEAYANTTHI